MSKQSKKLSERLKRHNYYGVIIDDNTSDSADIIKAVRELEVENERLKCEVDTASCLRCINERDALRAEVEALRRNLVAATRQINDEQERAAIIERERDELRVLTKASYDTAKKFEAERDAALARLADAKEWKEIADTWAKQHHELGTALDAAEAKLAAVREFANSDRCMNGHADDILAILDGAPATLTYQNAPLVGVSGPKADTEVVTREVVLWQSGYGPAQYVALAEHSKHEYPSLELARATVTFHVKKPRKG